MVTRWISGWALWGGQPVFQRMPQPWHTEENSPGKLTRPSTACHPQRQEPRAKSSAAHLGQSAGLCGEQSSWRIGRVTYTDPAFCEVVFLSLLCLSKEYAKLLPEFTRAVVGNSERIFLVVFSFFFFFLLWYFLKYNFCTLFLLDLSCCLVRVRLLFCLCFPVISHFLASAQFRQLPY